MNTQSIEIELLEDTVISATSATSGAHHSLDYIPGATLLGATAARLYAELGEQAFGVFHGNQARFSDGLPLADGRLAWPVPLSWHEAKGEPARDGGRIDGKRIRNLTVDSRPAGVQLKQLRDAHVDLATGRWIRPGMRLRMKTALEQGTAAEGQLFGYEALPAGTRFLASVSMRKPQLLERTLALLEQGILIGRSRSAEYGRARIRRIDAPAAEPAGGPQDFTIIYLASDLCLVDAQAQPCLQPHGTMLGLGELALEPARSFIRTRRYAPWNAHRRAHDMERQVIVRGSVLAFDGRPDGAAIERLQAEGAGLYRNQGLGRVLVDPWFVAGPLGAFESADSTDAADQATASAPDTPLIRLLRTRAGMRDRDIRLVRHAEQITNGMVGQLERARLASGLLESEAFGPSRSQWGKLQKLAEDDSREALFAEIFGQPDERDRSRQTGLARPDHENWNTKIWIDSEQKTISEWFRGLLEEQWAKEPVQRKPDRLRRLVQHLARLMAKEASQ